MTNYSCNCALPALTNGTKCCEHCANNPNRTYQLSESYSYVLPTNSLKPLHICSKCDYAFMCTGNCTECALACVNCWNLKDGEQVVIKQH